MFDKIKQLSKDTAIYGISTMLGRFINFFLVPFYTNIFAPDQYGIISNLYAVIAIMNIVFIYGLDSAYLKFAESDEFPDKKTNFSTPFISVITTSILFVGLFAIGQGYVNQFLSIPHEYNYLIYLGCGILFFDALAVLPFIYLRLERKTIKFSSIKILNIVLNIVLNLFLILYLGMGIEAVFISNLAASILSLILLLPSILKKLNFSFDKALYMRLLKFGLPYLPGGLAAIFIQVIDRPIVEHLTDLTTLGIYQANYKLGIFMMLYVVMFQYAWQPFFLQTAKEENAQDIFAKVLTIFMIIGSLILVFLSVFIVEIVTTPFLGKTLIGKDYWSGISIVPVVLLGYLFNGMYVNFSAGIYIKEKSLYVPIVMGIGAATNIVANFILIPLIGIMGAAIATLASYFMMAAGFYFAVKKHYPVNYEFGKIFRIFVSIGIITLLYWALNQNEIINIWTKLLLVISYLFLLPIMRIITSEELNFIKKKVLRRK
ncbi:MAG TPA: oligosaccharide flippase family protein [Ignavibacteriaceae bacterium]|nr:oligosaccharide flippase family protein [Ignavibacteriaceae bacterium]